MTASRPLAHSSIRVMLGISWSTPRSRRRAGASSSTMTVCIVTIGNLDCRDGATLPARRVRQLEAVTHAVQLGEPRSRVGDAHAPPPPPPPPPRAPPPPPRPPL